jgi:hypothetical protein
VEISFQGEQDGTCGLQTFDQRDSSDPQYIGFECSEWHEGAQAEVEVYEECTGFGPYGERQYNYECMCDTRPQCSDGIDNDSDGRIDSNDAQCSGAYGYYPEIDNELCGWVDIGGQSYQDTGPCREDVDETDPNSPSYIECNLSSEGEVANVVEYSSCSGSPIIVDVGEFECMCPGATNLAPNAPTINGPITTNTGVIPYTFSGSVDPEGETIRYEVDWGDGSANQFSPASATLASGGSQIVSHNFSVMGTYTIRARAIDVNGNPSLWTSLTIFVQDRIDSGCPLQLEKDVNNGVNKRQLSPQTHWEDSNPFDGLEDTLGTTQPYLQDMAAECGQTCDSDGVAVCGLEYTAVEYESSCSGQAQCVTGDSLDIYSRCYGYDSGDIVSRPTEWGLGGGCGPEDCTEIWTYDDWAANTCGTVPAPSIDRFYADPDLIANGSISTLRWKVSGEVTSCQVHNITDNISYTAIDFPTLSQDIFFARLEALPFGVDFELTCSGPGGSVGPTAPITVTVGTSCPLNRDVITIRTGSCVPISSDASTCSSVCNTQASSQCSGGYTVEAASVVSDCGANAIRCACDYTCDDCSVAAPQCSDNADNDLDGLIDENDPGCWIDPLDSNTYDSLDDDETHVALSNPPTVELRVDNDPVFTQNVYHGDQLTLSWSNAAIGGRAISSCVGSGNSGWSYNVPPSDLLTGSDPNQFDTSVLTIGNTYDFSLTCTNVDGDSNSWTIAVTIDAPPAPTSVTIGMRNPGQAPYPPGDVAYNSRARLTWSTVGPTTRCMLGPSNTATGWNPNDEITHNGANADDRTDRITSNVNVQISCCNGPSCVCPGVSCTNSNILNIGARPRIDSFSIPDDPIPSGGSVEASWGVTNATWCRGVLVSGSPGNPTWDGRSIGVSGGTETIAEISASLNSYSLRCGNAYGTHLVGPEVVEVKNPIVSITALPLSVLKGKTTTIRWQAQFIDSPCTLREQVYAEDYNTGQTSEPTSDKTYEVNDRKFEAEQPGSSYDGYDADAFTDDNAFIATDVESPVVYTISCSAGSRNVGDVVTIRPFIPGFSEE